jgi:opacity protein-like surface antigen
MRVRSAALLLVGLFASPLMAQAQGTPRYEIAGGYSFMHDQDISENFPKGWVLSGGGRVMTWLDLVAEVGGNSKTLSIPGDAPKIKVSTFMVGPKFTARAYGRVTPFAQVLLGAAWASTKVVDVGDTVTDFAYQPGGGIDWAFKPNVGARVEGDYRIIRTDAGSSKESRFVVAAVFRF